jgi:propanol-preferring alcohol dehydrogenase
VLQALCSATSVVGLDTSEDKLKFATEMGADEGSISGDDAIARVKDMTRGEDTEVICFWVFDQPGS